MGRNGAEERPRDCHDQRCRHALSCHVADAEEQFLVADVEVEQVASHLLGRLQQTVYLQVVAFGIGRERLGYHGLLNVAGHAQFAADALLLGIYPVDALEGASEQPHDDGEHGQSGGYEGKHLERHDVEVGVDVLMLVDDGHRPSHALVHGRIVYVEPVSLAVVYHLGARLPLAHFPLNGQRLLVVVVARERQRDLLGVGQAVHGAHQYFARVRYQQVLRMRVDVLGLDDAVEPVQRHVDEHHGRDEPARLAHRHRVARREPMRRHAHVGVGPVRLAGQHHLLVPLALRVVVGHAPHVDVRRRVGHEVEGEDAVASPSVLAGHVAYAAPHHVYVVFHHVLHQFLDSPERVVVPRCRPDVVLQRQLHVAYHILYLQARLPELAFREPADRLLDAVVGVEIQDGERQ